MTRIIVSSHGELKRATHYSVFVCLFVCLFVCVCVWMRSVGTEPCVSDGLANGRDSVH